MLRSFLTAALIAGGILVLATPVLAKTCTKLGFSVNDYGKEIPTRDSKLLLDKYVASWTKEQGIKKYTTSPKTVTCELFLDFGFFDEHTCKAVTTICWDGPPYVVEKDQALKQQPSS